MKRLPTSAAWLPLLLCLLAGPLAAHAQFGSFADVPIEISVGEAGYTGYQNGVATADGEVSINYGDVSISCEHAEYNAETRDILVSGSVRIYRQGRLFTADRAVYNLETKRITAADFHTQAAPFRVAGESVDSLGGNAYIVTNGYLTTNDNSIPGYHIRAKSVRIYPKDKIILTHATLYLGRTPVLWLPYVYQSLNRDQGFLITPGFHSTWGAHLLTSYSFPIGESTSGKLRVDLMSKRGVGAGFEANWGNAPRSSDSTPPRFRPLNSATPSAEGEPSTPSSEKLTADAVKEKGDWGRFRSYFIDDASPNTNRTALNREPIDPSRYRISLQNRTYLGEDLYASININKLSDARFLQDFAQNEFRHDPNPDNAIAITKWNENYSATLTIRKNLNVKSFEMTERLPEAALDVKRIPLGDSGFFYEGETSGGFYKRNFETSSLFSDYESFRADSFHQITYPGTYFDWLSLVPRIGIRGTYYSKSGFYADRKGPDAVPETGTDPLLNTNVQRIVNQGGLFRPVLNAGAEASFKFSREFDQVESRTWGLDGLRHVVQPYTNLSLVYSGQDPTEILQFDRYTAATHPLAIDFPQFNSIDSIDNWSVLRLGVQNRLQTKRDGSTLNWMELNSFFDVNLQPSEFLQRLRSDGGNFSNVVNNFRWQPLPWARLAIESQIPLLDEGFTEVDTTASFMVNQDLQVDVGHRHLGGHKFLQDSSLVSLGGYLRINENWGLSIRESYELDDSTLEYQSYEIHHDLANWVASLGLFVRDNRTSTSGNVTDLGVVLSFTLRDLPNIYLPVSFNPDSGSGQGSSGRNR